MKCQKQIEIIKRNIIEELDVTKEVTDEDILDLIDEQIVKSSREAYFSISEKSYIRKQVFHEIRRLGILQELIDNTEITEIMVNGTENIFIEKRGKIFKWEHRFTSVQKLEDVIQQIVAKCNRTVNESSPIVDARLENGARVNVVLRPVALNGPIVTIRRFPDQPIQMEDLIGYGTLSKNAAEELKLFVRAKYNIFISGGTGSGKTTFLNALTRYIPKDERIITIEDSAELQIQEIENLVRLETRNANVEGCREINIRELIRSALRMRPDRIIVGEVRGAESVDLLMAMNTGHEGSLSTGHSNNSKDMLSRLETMVLMGIDLPLEAVRRQIAAAIDLIIHLGRVRDGSRKILEISEVAGIESGEILLNPLYRFAELEEKEGRTAGCLKKVGKLRNTRKLQGIGMKEEK